MEVTGAARVSQVIVMISTVRSWEWRRFAFELLRMLWGLGHWAAPRHQPASQSENGTASSVSPDTTR